MSTHKNLVFIDDSGDPGFKSGSSSNFIMAAVLFANPEVAESAMYGIDNYRASLGWKDTKTYLRRQKTISLFLKIRS